MAYNLSLSKKRREIVIDYLKEVNGKYIVWASAVDKFTVPEALPLDTEFLAAVNRLSQKNGGVVLNDLRTAAFVQ